MGGSLSGKGGLLEFSALPEPEGPGLDECAEVHSEAFLKPTVPSVQRVEMLLLRRQLSALSPLRQPQVKHKRLLAFNHSKHVLRSLKR